MCEPDERAIFRIAREFFMTVDYLLIEELPYPLFLEGFQCQLDGLSCIRVCGKNLGQFYQEASGKAERKSNDWRLPVQRIRASIRP